MDRTAEMAAFVRTVEAGGFTGAARRLDLTPSAVSKLVGRLEDRLGVQLLHRTTRRVQVTAEGEAFFARARDILVALDEAEAEASKAHDSPRGRLRMACGVAFGVHQLTGVLPDFLAAYPHIKLDLTITDLRLRVNEEAYDLSVRVGPLESTTIVARRIASFERVICAAPRYLERHGTPRSPDELANHHCLWNSSLPELRNWPFKDGTGVRLISVDGPFVASNNETILRLALAGVGITRLPDIMVGDALREGRLVPLLMEHSHQEPATLYATYPSHRNLSTKVRVMIDFLVERFGHAPWRQG